MRRAVSDDESDTSPVMKVKSAGALKMLDVKMTDQFAEHEIAGHENAGIEIAGHKRVHKRRTFEAE